MDYATKNNSFLSSKSKMHRKAKFRKDRSLNRACGCLKD